MLTLLFDIDGTLISTGGAGGAALQAAMRDAFGVMDPADVPLSGRTDRGIASQLFAAHAIEDSLENWDRFRDTYLHHLELLLPQRQGHVLPGVSAVLERASAQVGIQLGLLTGNVRHGARLKLDHYRLSQYFRFGGYGDRHADRNGVAHEALVESRQHAAAAGITSREVWVIGDTPLDVACARAIGARALAVATGVFSSAELTVAQPDVLVDNLSDLAAICEHLGLGGTG